jgi:hypothetical protein
VISIPLRFAAVLLLLLAMACTTYNVQADAAPGIDFSAYKTFAQKPPPSTASNLPGYSVIEGEHIQAAIAHELEARGLSQAGEQSADLIIVFSIDGQPRQDVQWDGGYWGWYGDAYTVNYVQGTLTIDVFERKAKKLVWHAYGQTNLYGNNNADRRVDDAIRAIMKDFPIPLPKPSS